MAKIIIRLGAEGRFNIIIPYNSSLVAKVKNILGRRWHSEEKLWSVPASDGLVEQLLALFAREEIELDPSLWPVEQRPRGQVLHCALVGGLEQVD